MNFPTSIPEHDPSSLWALQQQLLSMAEVLVGERDRSKKIHQPGFHKNGPQIRNTPKLDGVFVELGPGSKVYWPTVVYEMAHETIHLLNPTVSYTNWLEEGIAVEFSIHAQRLFDVPIQAPSSGPYLEALEMVRALPGGAFSAGYRAREVAGALSTVTFQDLSTLFPGVKPTALKRLVEKCAPR